MRLRMRQLMAAVFASGNLFVLLVAGAATEELPPRRFDLDKLTCAELSKLKEGEERDRILIYMNGYLDGTYKTTRWDAEVVGKRIDRVLLLCKANPQSTLLDAFKRAWTQ